MEAKGVSFAKKGTEEEVEVIDLEQEGERGFGVAIRVSISSFQRKKTRKRSEAKRSSIAEEGTKKMEQDDEEEESPLKSILVVKKESKMDMKAVEDVEDCFILDFDPFESFDISKLSINCDDKDEVSVIAQKGKVACRDYPHPRHLCVKFPFQNDKIRREEYCEMCFCYVCDLPAPCKYWTRPQPGHCHAAENVEDWELQRKAMRQLKVALLIVFFACMLFLDAVNASPLLGFALGSDEVAEREVRLLFPASSMWFKELQSILYKLHSILLCVSMTSGDGSSALS